MNKPIESIEEIILRHPRRGMDLLAPHLPADFCRQAAALLYGLPRGTVLLTTGFIIGDFTETDGPAGTQAVAKALKALGFSPVIVCDRYCQGVFESQGLAVEYFPLEGTAETARELLKKYNPVALFSLERCGRAADGDYKNMRGISIRPKTAPLDLLFTEADASILTIGVGDGGNELGMGNLAPVISEKLSLDPCVIGCRALIIATVSNWGGYGLCACLSRLSGQKLVPTPVEIHSFIEGTLALGSRDGVTGAATVTEDSFDFSVTAEILEALAEAI